MEKDLITNKEPVLKRINIVAISSIICFLLALYVFGYASDKYKPEPGDFSISKAVANGNGITAATIVFVIIGSALLVYLHYLRGLKEGILLRSITIFIILGLFIAIIFVTPFKKDGSDDNSPGINNAHAGIAGTAFILVFLYNLYTYYIFYKNYKTKLPIIFAVINFLVLVGLFVPVIMEKEEAHKMFSGQTENKTLHSVFAAFENVNYLSLLVVIGLLGFYKI